MEKRATGVSGGRIFLPCTDATHDTPESTADAVAVANRQSVRLQSRAAHCYNASDQLADLASEGQRRTEAIKAAGHMLAMYTYWAKTTSHGRRHASVSTPDSQLVGPVASKGADASLALQARPVACVPLPRTQRRSTRSLRGRNGDVMAKNLNADQQAAMSCHAFVCTRPETRRRCHVVRGL